MELLTDYGLFLLKTLTVLTAVLLVLMAGRRRGPRRRAASLRVRCMNDAMDKRKLAMASAMHPPAARRKMKKTLQEARRARLGSQGRARTFVLRFKGDLRASQAEQLREEVSAVLEVARRKDEVLMILESPGGSVSGYGLAASQLQRIRARRVQLTVAVDRVAASGGYMMAAVADRILAAPFAVVGSIGVVGQLPNFSRLLKKHDIDYEMHTAGRHKRTLSMLGENTEEGRNKFREDLQVIHNLFRQHVAQYRPDMDMEALGTGEIWLGTRARELGLVDEIMTSDEYLLRRAAGRSIYSVQLRVRKGLAQRMTESAAQLADSIRGGRW